MQAKASHARDSCVHCERCIHMEDAYLLLSLEGYVATSCVRAQKRTADHPARAFLAEESTQLSLVPLATKKDIFLSTAQPTHQGTKSVVLVVVFVVVGTRFISTEEQFFEV